MNPLHKAALALEAINSQVDDTTTRTITSESQGRSSQRLAPKTRATKAPKHSRPVPPVVAGPNLQQPPPNRIKTKPLPSPLPRKLTRLPPDEHTLLLSKQAALLALTSTSTSTSTTTTTALAATLIFAQSSAGTAVCLSPSGHILTCAHCLSEDVSDPATTDAAATQWLIFSSGRIVQTRCIAVDARRDLALLQVVAAQRGADLEDVETASASASSPSFSFPGIPLSPVPPRLAQRIACVGHPGSEDLEDPRGGRTGYPIVAVSGGRFRGLARGQDVQDNSEIGALQHDCWTYWGHSGAPLVDERGGKATLVGVHSSWDEETGMRRGVAWEAVRGFLEEWEGGRGGDGEGRENMR